MKKQEQRGFRFVNEGLIHGEFPKRATKHSAAYDISAVHDQDIMPGETKLVGTGLTVYMQDDEYLAIHARSSLILKKGLILGNSVGIIDSDFAGNEVKIILTNISETPVYIKQGEKIAQAIFNKYLVTDIDHLTEKADRKGGLGHTGGMDSAEKGRA